MIVDVRTHYDLLVREGNDPVLDPEPLRAYMDGWDGPRFLDMLALSGHEKVLEIGCGTGRLALKTAPLCRQLVGLDLSPRSIRQASKHLHEYRNVTLICGDFLTATIPGPFDVIYSSLTTLHMADKAAVAGRIAELLAPGGHVILSLDKGRDDHLDFGTRRIAVYPDDPDEMAAHLQNAGLTVVETAEVPFAWLIKAQARHQPQGGLPC